MLNENIVKKKQNIQALKLLKITKYYAVD